MSYIFDIFIDMILILNRIYLNIITYMYSKFLF